MFKKFLKVSFSILMTVSCWTRSVAAPLIDETEPIFIRLFAERDEYAKKVLSSSTANKKDCFVRINGLAGHFPNQLENIIQPLKQSSKKSSVSSVRNRLILHGPSGSGKTALARKIAEQAQAELFEILACEIPDKYYGCGAKKIDNLFAKAHEKVDSSSKPAVIFIDFVESIAMDRLDEKVQLDILLTRKALWKNLEAIEKDPRFLVVIATEKEDQLSNSFVHHFDGYSMELTLPDEETRLEFFKNLWHEQVKTPPLPPENILLKKLSQQSEGLSFRALKNVFDGGFFDQDDFRVEKPTEKNFLCSLNAIKLRHFKNSQSNSFFELLTSKKMLAAIAAVVELAVLFHTSDIKEKQEEAKVN